MQLLTTAFPDRPVLDLAVSEALLRQVAEGRRSPTLRIFRPGPTVAFGRLDVHRPGFADAVAAARAHGATPVVRVVGGHAAAFDAASLVVEDITRAQDPAGELQERFRDRAERLVGALRTLGVDAREGELPGEYCPGAHSVHAGGRIKVAGLAQRTVRGAALTSAVVVVGGGPRLRAIVADVYAALGMPVDPAVAGALDEAVPGLEPDGVAAAIRDAYAGGRELREAQIDDALLAEAEALVPRHELPRPGAG